KQRRAALGLVAAQPLEDAGSVVDDVGQDVHGRLLPWDQASVHPDRLGLGEGHPGPPGGSPSAEPTGEYRAEDETISRLAERPALPARRAAQDQGRPGARAPALDEEEPQAAGGAQEGGFVVHQESRQDRATSGSERRRHRRE